MITHLPKGHMRRRGGIPWAELNPTPPEGRSAPLRRQPQGDTALYPRAHGAPRSDGSPKSHIHLSCHFAITHLMDHETKRFSLLLTKTFSRDCHEPKSAAQSDKRHSASNRMKHH